METPDTPLDVVVRFSTSHPDITLRVNSPTHTANLSLKQQLRAKLEAPASGSRLRLIHAGRVLPDAAALQNSLNVTFPPPRRSDDDDKSAKAKGKLPVREKAAPTARIYIHCSVGDALTAAELTAEARAAQDADAALLSPQAPPPGAASDSAPQPDNATTTTPAPRGFDRLLAAGFTAPEVAALRAQFLAIQAHTHTPDSMPSGAELLALEERWLDNGSNPAAGGAGGDTGGMGSEDAGALEDMLYGNLIGFFWPVAAMCWLMREEGVWSRRRQIAVLSGFLVNLVFGFLRAIN